MAEIFYSKLENLVLRAMSEIIGSAIDQTCIRFQVSGFKAAAGLKSSQANQRRNSEKRISNIE
jgi:hypothetical protein